MANMTFKTNLLPNSDLEYSLGSTTAQWNIYGKLFGELGNNPNNTTTFLRGDNTWANTITGNLRATGTTNDCTIGVDGGAGALYFWSNGTESGYTNRGIWTPAHGTGEAKAVLTVDTNNNVTLNGNATSAIKATQDGAGNTITSKYVTLDTTQTITASKTFTGTPNIKNHNRWPSIYFRITNASNPVSAIIWTGANESNQITSSKTLLRNYSYSSTASTELLTYYEDFSTPDVTKDRTSSATYYLLTTKSAVTVAQGGTGATSAAGARANLAVPYMVTETYPALVPTNGTNNWIKVGTANTSYGLLPSQSGSSGSGHNYLGTSSWYWKYAYIDEIYSVHTRGAVWNDYAEYRKDNEKEKEIQKPGRCIYELGDGSLALTTKRLMLGCEIISDTFGFSIGQDEENGYNTPIASSGRVLAYPYESIEEFKKAIGRPVCSGPNGTISIMTDEEYITKGYCAIGTVSEIPTYEEWGTGKVKVDGRVWIRVR